MNFRLSVLCVLALMLSHAHAFAGTSEANAKLVSAIDQVVAVADRSKSTSDLAKNVRPVLEKALSFPAMTRRAVGPGWRQFTEAQKNEAVNLFTTLIIRTYSEKFTIGERPEVTYKAASEPAPGRVEIPTTLLYKGSRYEVVYRLEAAEGWKITDIVVEGVSFVANYRTQFDVQFKSGGAEAVLAALRKSVKELE